MEELACDAVSEMAGMLGIAGNAGKGPRPELPSLEVIASDDDCAPESEDAGGVKPVK